MTIEEAIKTAIDYETKVRDTYRDAVEAAGALAARDLFKLMAGEEQQHVDILVRKLKELKETGAITTEELRSAVPDSERIGSGITKLKGDLAGGSGAAELEYLRKACDAETETSMFYERVVSELPESERQIFARFLEVERGHLALVQAQIDELAGTGYWFDVREFNLEG